MPFKLITYLYNLHKLRENQWRSYPEIKKMQDKKLKGIIEHAYEKVGYYRRLFDQAGIKPKDIKNENDLSKIPITTKADFQSLTLNDRIAKDTEINKCFNLRTSGSTGRPLDILVTEEECLKSKTLIFLNMFFENSCQLTDKILRVVTPAYITKKRWLQHLGILREYFISIFDDIDIQLNTFLQTKPHAIRGYSSGIKSLALRIKERELKIKPPKMIFTTAEVLDKIDRKIISSIFQAEVIDYYCCNEAGIIAHECKEHGGYHINNDNVIIELIKEDGTCCKSGEEGDIVITSLNRHSMPFIRYQIGDKGIATDKKCRCGRSSPLIETIVGRGNDQIILPDDNIIPASLLLNIITDIPGIIEFQIVQKEKGKININIIKDNNLGSEMLMNIIKSKCQEILDGKIEIEVSIVKEIARENTGKLKVVKNEIGNLRSHIL